MTAYNFSVVQLCPEATRDEANALAESLGYGPNNLSVKLQDAELAVWYGCHAWWMEEALYQLDNLPPELGVINSIREGADPLTHWNETLLAHGLIVFPEEV